MVDQPVGKRRFHAFLSHAHVDKQRADELHEWLRDIAGIPVWYDATQMPSGATIAQMLPEAIENSRSLLLLMSEESVSRGWVQQEYHTAINHQTQHPDFRIIPLKLDNVKAPGFLQNYSALTLPPSGIDVRSAAGVLRGLYQPATSIDPVNGKNVYVSRGWHQLDEARAGMVCSALTNAGLQLISDSEDHTSWLEDRIIAEIEGCGAFVAVLPYRPSSAYKTSKYVLREWALAESRGIPCLAVVDERMDLPPDVRDRPGHLVLGDEELRADRGSLDDAIETLSEDWIKPKQAPYIFLITDFDPAVAPLRAVVKDLVQTITTMPCIQGEYIKGDGVQRQIYDSIGGARIVLADISDDSPNVYLELGAARAANVPVYLLRRGEPRRPPFMLRDQQVWDYSSDADLLARVVRILYPYRRTLLNQPGI
ncbi:TIR domain-containing protein [Amycolatopsis sp. lyj-23]|uniref:TIR domain-containing protein n=1 Tax=Amycolatopsis sp. lyj-23 TaxID=2789283 RepID=UPI00397AFCE6